MMIEERTRRLRLLAATCASVKAELEDPVRLGVLIDACVPPGWPPETLRDARPVFAGWHEAHPDWSGWLEWYAVRVDQGRPELCGSVGFKGPPDASGMIEIGYSVLAEHQGAGLASEMVGGLVGWAFSQAGVRCIEAETTLDNPASIRVLERNGFQSVGDGSEPGSIRYRLGRVERRERAMT
jgi:RimJ/RimL family protein N-acetyltransferase